ncbi:nitrite/sulfite reductase domain-containing protein [Desulforhopalus singaporensis]|uniref:Nitrite/Sulfite reductase ferredoxin-like half domain-containing protein n=1 Tax=Desulforhopalus singaporensis TaxID=91360 RepID=A0A1H0MWH4_9BACT|nr:NAD(P)/FAD-dependent oxidoreductase [Desulforhopalus singaporensis]SDO84731.1 Nitrite/Sulfite reductase ferredoxin-like half domain-containing protein [Desulforhopalus singaporensis]
MKTTPPKGAILQRDKETYAIVPRIPGGLLKKHHLRAISDVVEKYDIPIVKITSGQRIALVGLKLEDVAAVYEDLGMDPGKATELCLHYVQSCPGTEVCKFGVRDSLGFGIQLEDMLAGSDMPAKFKIGVSGCQFCCAENHVRDLGMFAKKSGWTISFGGHSGKNARVGNIIAEDISEEEAIELITKCIDYYRANAKPRERAGRFIERTGIEALMAQLR